MAYERDDRALFEYLSSRITQLLYGRTKNVRDFIGKTLDELNSISYYYPIVTNSTKAALLFNQCCSLIPPEDTEVVLKCCKLLTSLITEQNVVIEGRTLTIVVEWCLSALKHQSSDVDVLTALDALIRQDSKRDLITEIVGNKLNLSLAKDADQPETALIALQCLESCTCPSEERGREDADKFAKQYQTCFEIFLSHLCNYAENSNKLLQIKIITVCLRGLQNVTSQSPELLKENLGVVLGVIKTYMLYGLRGVELIKPQKVMPSALSIPEPPTNMSREKRGGKITKQRKHKQASKGKKPDEHANHEEEAHASLAPFSNLNLDNSFARLKTSDSEFSDTEGGNEAKLAIMAGRARQAALGLFLHVAKMTEKSVMFSYWSSFIPENSLSAKHNLATCILKDTSARGRMAALNVLLLLLTSSKLYLAQAEKGDHLAFTPFSVTIGLMIRELHRCLSLALNENSTPVLAQVLKCLAALVQATPYHKLSPGLITKVIRSVKSYIHHRDPTIQVTALIVLGCTLASEPVVPETREAFIKHADESNCKTDKERRPDEDSEGGFDFAEFSSDDEAPPHDAAAAKLPWLLERCFRNLGLTGDGEIAENNVPTAVKLESLQILSATSRNYFASLLAPHLGLITPALDAALADKYTDVRLHAGRAVDFIGQAMNQYFSGENDRAVSIDQCLPFWQTLLNGSLIALLQSEHHAILRAVGCDCLGSIGSYAFEQLPRERQILCVTLLLACSRDEENSVKGAAVRALSICVLHPSLREDVGFVVDTAEAIRRVLQDENLMVRMKSSWSLGNLSDAMVLNKSNPNLPEEIPDSLLLNLLRATINASGDCDKIKVNIVRALGNFLQLITEDLLAKSDVKELVEQAINVLAKSCTTGPNMKVRWNSCYAVGSAMKNSTLFASNIDWQPRVFNALMDLVVNFRNFKVRINAAVALSSPTRREFYDQCFHPCWLSLCRALETSQNMEDFSEYKHRDHLVEQICLSLGHLARLMAREDLAPLRDGVSLYSGCLKGQMSKVWDRLLPEKSTVLFDASAHLASLNDTNLSPDQRETLRQLAEIFRQDY